MNALKCAILAIAIGACAVPAAAQNNGYDGAQFVSAIKKGNNDDALKFFQGNPSLVNARDMDGLTALIAAIQNRDTQWTAYLLRQGADPNLALRNGETPLMAAARLGLQDVVDWLLSVGAQVNDANKMGETALILAVQQRQTQIVQALLKAGADPDKADSAQGYSARDYAKRDSRTPDLLRLIQAAKPKP